MGVLIEDEFTFKKVSRQRKWQLRRKRDGKCVTCGAQATTVNHCAAHAADLNTRAKDRHAKIRARRAIVGT